MFRSVSMDPWIGKEFWQKGQPMLGATYHRRAAGRKQPFLNPWERAMELHDKEEDGSAALDATTTIPSLGPSGAGAGKLLASPASVATLAAIPRVMSNDVLLPRSPSKPAVAAYLEPQGSMSGSAMWSRPRGHFGRYSDELRVCGAPPELRPNGTWRDWHRGHGR